MGSASKEKPIAFGERGLKHHLSLKCWLFFFKDFIWFFFFFEGECEHKQGEVQREGQREQEKQADQKA